MFRVLPAYVAAASVTFLAVRWASTRIRVRKERSLVNDGQVGLAWFTVLKVLACTALVSIQTAITTRAGGGWEKIALCIAYAYADILAGAALAFPGTYSVHSNAVLLVSLCSYVYRDILPFATFTLAPKDWDEGWLLWAKIAALFVAAVVIPLASPRRYFPVDPEVRNSFSDVRFLMCGCRTRWRNRTQNKPRQFFRALHSFTWIR